MKVNDHTTSAFGDILCSGKDIFETCLMEIALIYICFHIDRDHFAKYFIQLINGRCFTHTGLLKITLKKLYCQNCQGHTIRAHISENIALPLLIMWEFLSCMKYGGGAELLITGSLVRTHSWGKFRH